MLLLNKIIYIPFIFINFYSLILKHLIHGYLILLFSIHFPYLNTLYSIPFSYELSNKILEYGKMMLSLLIFMVNPIINVRGDSIILCVLKISQKLHFNIKSYPKKKKKSIAHPITFPFNNTSYILSLYFLLKKKSLLLFHNPYFFDPITKPTSLTNQN